jgi:hypothetical protein
MLIRKKILFTTVLLTITLMLWMYSSLTSVYAYRRLTLTIGQLAAELKTTSKLRSELDRLMAYIETVEGGTVADQWIRPFALTPRLEPFQQQLTAIEETLYDYEAHVRSRMLSVDGRSCGRTGNGR